MRNTPPGQIIATTADHFGLEPALVLSDQRDAPLVLARHIAMYLCREMTDLSFPIIGVIFHRNHSTVYYAWGKIQHLRPQWEKLDLDISAITHQIQEQHGE